MALSRELAQGITLALAGFLAHQPNSSIKGKYVPRRAVHLWVIPGLTSI